jgi:hypothetical protein
MNQVFRVSKFVILFLAVIFVIMAAVAVWFLATKGITLLACSFVGYSILAVVALLESLRSHILLTKDNLEYTRLFKTYKLPRSLIQKVIWEKGCGVSVQTMEGKWVALPNLMGRNSQSLANSIRAWLKRGPDTKEDSDA